MEPINPKDIKRLSSVEHLPEAVGWFVRSLHAFSGVPCGTRGVIDAHYKIDDDHEGVMVAWDLPTRPLPTGYRFYDGRPAIVSGLLRDGFGRTQRMDETEMLEIIQ